MRAEPGSRGYPNRPDIDTLGRITSGAARVRFPRSLGGDIDDAVNMTYAEAADQESNDGDLGISFSATYLTHPI